MSKETINNPWVSVEERLPEDGDMCLAYVDGEILLCSFLSDEEEGQFDVEGYRVTYDKEMVSYWMPIPEIPKE